MLVWVAFCKKIKVRLSDATSGTLSSLETAIEAERGLLVDHTLGWLSTDPDNSDEAAKFMKGMEGTGKTYLHRQIQALLVLLLSERVTEPTKAMPWTEALVAAAKAILRDVQKRARQPLQHGALPSSGAVRSVLDAENRVFQEVQTFVGEMLAPLEAFLETGGAFVHLQVDYQDAAARLALYLQGAIDDLGLLPRRRRRVSPAVRYDGAKEEVLPASRRPSLAGVAQAEHVAPTDTKQGAIDDLGLRPRRPRRVSPAVRYDGAEEEEEVLSASRRPSLAGVAQAEEARSAEHVPPTDTKQFVALVLQAIVRGDTATASTTITAEDVSNCWIGASETLFNADITERRQPAPSGTITDQHQQWWRALCQSDATVRPAALTGSETSQVMSDIYWAVQEHAWAHCYQKAPILVD